MPDYVVIYVEDATGQTQGELVGVRPDDVATLQAWLDSQTVETVDA